jgi:hypothetical protein
MAEIFSDESVLSGEIDPMFKVSSIYALQPRCRL